MFVEGEGMRKLSDAFLAELTRRVDIMDVVSEYVSLRRAGKNFVGLCPFHNERTPSFSVSPDRQLYYCFGCGAGGNVIQFIMDIEGLPFLDAVRTAADRAGVELPATPNPSVESAESANSERQRMKDAHELAAKYYSYILMNTSAGAQALEYLQSRGLAKSTLVRFRMGYAEPRASVVVFLQKRGFEPQLLLDAGLALAYGDQLMDRFRGRVMIPIMDAQGSVVAFGGRAISESVQPKYLNSPETRIFHKSKILFHQHEARKFIRQEGTAILMEGYMDVISASQAGIDHAVASLGTSFSEEQALLIKRMAKRLVIAYDGDSAGQSAAVRALDATGASGLECRVLVLPDGADPDEYIRRHGADVFRNQLTAATLTPVQFRIRRLRDQAELQSVAGRQTFIRGVLELLSQSASPIEVESELRQLSGEFSLSFESLKEEMTRIAKNVSKPKQSGMEKASQRDSELPHLGTKGHILAGQRVLHAMLCDETAYEYVMESGLDELPTPEQTALLALVYAFRAEWPQKEPSAFIDTIEDAELRQQAIALLMMDDAPAPSREVLDDYLRTMDIEKTMVEKRVAIEKWKYAQLQQDAEQAARLKERIEALNEKLQSLTLTPHQSHSH